jgi:ribosomal protein S2
MQGKIMIKKIADRCFENVAKFRYFGTTITNQNLIQEEIKRRLNSGKACYIQSRTFCLLVCCLKT